MAAASARQLLLGALLLLACAPLAHGGKRSFTLRVQSRGMDGAAGAPGRRRLLRNSTLPLHGAVKDYG
jgi:hypothetical protein